MPFPLAHPAAILPLRRFCPRYLNFPALVIGSLCPDLGYFSGPYHLDSFSHRFLAGSFGFCLPVGLFLFLVLQLVRSSVVGISPAAFRERLAPVCQRSFGSLFSVVVSLLIGAWTHLLFDSTTHQDGWLAKHFCSLQRFSPSGGLHRLCDFLYVGWTFSGVLWLALCYQRWLEKGRGRPAPTTAWLQWVSALLLASLILCVALTSRGAHRSLEIFPAAIITIGLVIGFVLVTTMCSAKPQA
jgi:hypothetical protein